jgi:hypothetical protein
MRLNSGLLLGSFRYLRPLIKLSEQIKLFKIQLPQCMIWRGKKGMPELYIAFVMLIYSLV